ncbi:MAG: Zn-dependent hydrolase [Bacteroidales bacterium]|nr:Zn-dependent hydrolase [Bacteroidales bacterium]
MKTLLRNLLFVIIAGSTFSCQNTPPAYQALFSGTTPTLNVEEMVMEPFVIYLDILQDNILYEQSNVPYTVIYETDDIIKLETGLILKGGIAVKNITYMIPEAKLVLELDGLNRNVQLEKYDEMISRKVNEFVSVKLSSDISHLSDNQKEMLRILFKVANIMDELFWKEACPNKEQILAGFNDTRKIEFFHLNYGPWERLNNDLPFLPGIGPKPDGAGFYPPDITKEEFESFEDDTKSSLYTMIRRNSEGNLESIPYHVVFKEQIEKAASLLLEAAELAEDEGFKRYLRLRAAALLDDNYLESDMAWMDMKSNDIDFVVGPIENYEDKLFNYKAAHEAFILIKDQEWSQRLSYISAFLPELQKELPVAPAYKKEVPGSDSDLGAYDAVYYAGDCNASSKTIAINLPNDERVQLAKGSRKLQLKNAIRYKFKEILVPISNVLIAEDQRQFIKFDAFFENTMFHEIAHGLGINNTINGQGTVRNALKEQYSAIEEGKADILGLFLVTKLSDMGELEDEDLMDNYVTFLASIFRSVRFGAASSHGKANMMRFYYFQEEGAFSRDEATGTYRIDFEKMQQAMNNLAEKILVIQGDGDYEAAKRLVEEKGYLGEDLQNDLDRLKALNIPVDIRFEQGPGVLGLYL